MGKTEGRRHNSESRPVDANGIKRNTPMENYNERKPLSALGESLYY